MRDSVASVNRILKLWNSLKLVGLNWQGGVGWQMTTPGRVGQSPGPRSQQVEVWPSAGHNARGWTWSPLGGTTHQGWRYDSVMVGRRA